MSVLQKFMPCCHRRHSNCTTCSRIWSLNRAPASHLPCCQWSQNPQIRRFFPQEGHQLPICRRQFGGEACSAKIKLWGFVAIFLLLLLLSLLLLSFFLSFFFFFFFFFLFLCFFLLLLLIFHFFFFHHCMLAPSTIWRNCFC